MANTITLRQIEYFISVVDTGQISRSRQSLRRFAVVDDDRAEESRKTPWGCRCCSASAKGVRLTRARRAIFRHVQNANVTVGRARGAAPRRKLEQISGPRSGGRHGNRLGLLMP